MDRVKALPMILLGCSLAAITVYAYGNLGYLGLWWDETAQFWISQGINHYAEPGTHPQGLIESLKLNRLQNLDPGGFTILEHYWTKANRDIEWIRTLPFSFLLILMLCMGALGWWMSKSWLLTVIGFSLPLAYSGTLYFGMENRAYSMEMAGVACGLLSLLYALERRSGFAFGILGLVCALFLTSRYSYVFFIMTACFTLLYCKPAGWGREFIRYVKNVALFCIPIMLVGSVIFHYMLRYQLWPEMTASEVLAPVYTRSSVLAGNENYLALLYRNTVSLPAFPISLSIVYYLFLQGPLHRRLKRRYSNIDLDYKITLIFVFVLAFQAISLFMSYLGIYPWDIQARWNAYLLPVSMIAFLTLLSEATMIQRACRAVSPATAKRRMVRGSLLSQLGALAFIGFATVHAATYRTATEAPWTDLSVQIKQYHALQNSSGKLFVTRYDIPALRYLYEFGPFRNLTEYPAIFRFESNVEWRNQEPIDAEEENIQYVVSGEPKNELQNRFPYDRLTEVAPGKKSLLEITERITSAK